MMNFFKSALIVSTLSLGATSLSLAKEAVGSGPNPFVDCGIGAALFPDTHWAAVSSNVIWDLGTTALTSATSSPETCSKQQVKAALFIRDVYPSIIEQTANGEGEHVTAMLEIFGCSVQSHSQIIESARKEIGAQVTTDGYLEKDRLDKSADYYNTITKTINHHYSNSCSI